MRTYITILLLSFTLGICISCGEDEENPVSSGGGTPSNGGTTTVFDASTQLDCGAANRKATKSNADVFCISLGYERATKYESVGYCRSGQAQLAGPWLTKVTCYKP